MSKVKLKLIEECVEDYLCDISLVKDFLNKTSKVRTMKKITGDTDHIKMEDLCCFMKYTMNKVTK